MAAARALHEIGLRRGTRPPPPCEQRSSLASRPARRAPSGGDRAQVKDLPNPMRLYEFHELPRALQHLAVGTTAGGLMDLLFDYDVERQTLRWWRVSSPEGSRVPKKGSIPIPTDLVSEAEKLLEAAHPPRAAEITDD